VHQQLDSLDCATLVRHVLLTLYCESTNFYLTYDHRTLKTRLPVRSALFKQRTGGLVVRWVTTSEYPLLYVFYLFAGPAEVCFENLQGTQFMTEREQNYKEGRTLCLRGLNCLRDYQAARRISQVK
jgi:hypothetical protein